MQVIGIGLSNIDLVAHVRDDFLIKHKAVKGAPRKFDDLAFARLRAELPQYDAIPGGCAANTVCGMAAYGVPARFYGKIGEDSFESLYRASFADYTVAYDVPAGSEESSQCAVLVTPDGERTFVYTHGASWDLQAGDIDTDLIATADMIVSEIYMFEFGQNAEVAKLVFETAQQKKTPLTMKAMDQDFGRRYAQKIRALGDANILDLLVGNHENLPSITGTTSLDDTLQAYKDWKCDVLLTANAGGAYFVSGGEVKHYAVEPVKNPRNTTGAGDQFLAGFLIGRMDGKAPHECIDFAATCAKSILMHDTARPPLVNKHSIRF